MTLNVFRFTGLNSALGLKAPVRVATTVNITLAGLQTIDGVILQSTDTNLRVLVKNQADSRQNGIYDSQSGNWTRSTDWDTNDDIVQGTEVHVIQGATQQGRWELTSADPITLGTSNITFSSTSALPFPDGSATSPGMNFAAESTTGFYRPGPSQIGVTLGGAAAALFATTGLTLGVAGTLLGALLLAGNTSGATTIKPQAVATGTLLLPAVSATDTLAILGLAGQTFTGQNIWNIASTIASGASAPIDDLKIQAATTIFTGNIHVTTAIGKVSLYQPTLSAASALTVDNAATLYVDNAPVGAGAGPLTISNAWSIFVNAGNVKFSGSGNAVGTITSGVWNAGAVTSSGLVQAATTLGISTDVLLNRDAANTLALRNGTNAQIFAVYNTFTDSTHFESFTVTWNSNVAYLKTLAGSGGGTLRNIAIGSDGNSNTTIFIRPDINSANGFTYNQNGLLFENDNSFDIGQSASGRPRSIYAGTLIQASSLRINQTPTAVTSAGATISSAADGANNLGHRVSVNLNGTTYWIPCSSVAF